MIIILYNLFFRYEYKIYEHKLYGATVIKLDKLTGKSTKSYPQKIIYDKNLDLKNTNNDKKYTGLYAEEMKMLDKGQ